MVASLLWLWGKGTWSQIPQGSLMGMLTSLQYMHPKISNQKSVRRILSEVSQKNLVGIFHREGSCFHPNSYIWSCLESDGQCPWRKQLWGPPQTDPGLDEPPYEFSQENCEFMLQVHVTSLSGLICLKCGVEFIHWIDDQSEAVDIQLHLWIAEVRVTYLHSFRPLHTNERWSNSLGLVSG